MSKLESIALELFAEKGFKEVTVDDIAVVAGSSARTLFPHDEVVTRQAVDASTKHMGRLPAPH